MRTLCPWESTTDTIGITDIPPHTTLLAKIEILKCIIKDFKVFFTRDMKKVLKDNLDDREISGTGFVQENLILSKLDESSPKISSQKTRALVKGGEQVLYIFEDRVSPRDYVPVVLEE